MRAHRLVCTALFASIYVAAAGCSSPPVPHYAVADRGADTDTDGIADIDDACPNDAEDGLPPKANDGCPATDPDNDGILLADDRCPNAKEDGLPPSADDGCPTDDTDGDGVADARDKCPAEPEDNGPPDPNDGCPSPDGDHDSIADYRDACPTQPETYNGYRDEDGCPDTDPGGGVAYDDQSSEIHIPESKKIEFDADSADLSAAGKQTITDVANVLRAHPEITRVEIEGHASSKGDLQYNVSLTDRRAQAVARALTAMGVDGMKLVPVGYGEYCPAIDRGDEVDEPKNRRVLFKTVVVNGVWQQVQRGCWRAQAAGIDPTKRRPIAMSGGQGQGPTQGPYVPSTGGI